MSPGLGTSSAIINGQLVPQTRSMYYAPIAVGPVIQGVPAAPPQTGAGGGSNAYGASDVSAMAASQPFSLIHSPVPWIIIFLVVGFVLLRYVHWGY